MDSMKRPVPDRAIEPWPPGWPLPLAAMAPSLRWEDMVEFYHAYSEAMQQPAPERPDAERPQPPASQRAA